MAKNTPPYRWRGAQSLRYNIFMTYYTPKAPSEALYEIKKSRFLAYAYPLRNKEERKIYANDLAERHPDARHICSAYIVGDPNNTTCAGFDDAGEPNGTAGRPILNVLQRKGVGDCAIFVARYFGGIKLGAGGLARAYGQAANLAIEAAKLRPFVAQTTLQICVDFAHEAFARRCVEQNGGQICAAHYDRLVRLVAQINADRVDAAQDQLRPIATFKND